MVFLFLELHPSQLDVNIHPAKTEVRFREDAGIYELVRRALERRSFPSWLQAERVAEQEESYGTDRSSGVSLIGQIENTFLLTLSEGHLYLLDQHAAEERVLYERLQQGKARSRELIAPQVVTLSAEERTFLDEHQAEVAACGFAVEPFGPQAFALRAIPDFLDPKEVGVIFSRLLARMRQEEDFKQALSCLGAIKAGQLLTREEQERLLHSWVQTTNPHACAHNRPVYFRLSLDEVRRKVGRTGLSCEFDREEE